MPFQPAATMLAFFMQTTVSASSARRLSETIGAAGEALLSQAATPPLLAEAAAERLYVGVDGAMVPLLHGEWAEVKTVSIGEVGPPVWEEEEWVVHTHKLSYFSRLAEVDDFIDQAQGELARRQVAQAARVCGLSDGARWIQRFFDSRCPYAVRILDFPHAVGYLAQVASACFDAAPEAAAWLERQRTELKDGDPRRVVAELHRLSLDAHEQDAPAARQVAIADAHDYLKVRLPMIEYAHFRAQGDPIGSGASESANKLVVERRLKGAGMHWQRAHVNPMLVLTTTAANDRWDELWPAAAAHQRATRRQRLLERHAPPPPPPPPAPSPPASDKPSYRPAAHHPWRRYPRARQAARPAA